MELWNNFVNHFFGVVIDPAKVPRPPPKQRDSRDDSSSSDDDAETVRRSLQLSECEIDSWHDF